MPLAACLLNDPQFSRRQGHTAMTLVNAKTRAAPKAMGVSALTLCLLASVSFLLPNLHAGFTLDSSSSSSSAIADGAPVRKRRDRDDIDVACKHKQHSGVFKGLDRHIHQPGSVEQHILNHPHELDYHNPNGAMTCPIWKNQTATEDICKSMRTHNDELSQCNKLVVAFKPVDDLRKSMDLNGSNRKEVCQSVQLHPDGLSGIFKSVVSCPTHKVLDASNLFGHL